MFSGFGVQGLRVLGVQGFRGLEGVQGFGVQLLGFNVTACHRCNMLDYCRTS